MIERLKSIFANRLLHLFQRRLQPRATTEFVVDGPVTAAALPTFTVEPGKDLNCDDPVRITICETAEECTEKLPLATGLARTEYFAIDDATGNGPVHPARV
jgi:hypothetical protein